MCVIQMIYNIFWICLWRIDLVGNARQTMVNNYTAHMCCVHNDRSLVGTNAIYKHFILLYKLAAPIASSHSRASVVRALERIVVRDVPVNCKWGSLS